MTILSRVRLLSVLYVSAIVLVVLTIVVAIQATRELLAETRITAQIQDLATARSLLRDEFEQGQEPRIALEWHMVNQQLIDLLNQYEASYSKRSSRNIIRRMRRSLTLGSEVFRQVEDHHRTFAQRPTQLNRERQRILGLNVFVLSREVVQQALLLNLKAHDAIRRRLRLYVGGLAVAMLLLSGVYFYAQRTLMHNIIHPIRALQRAASRMRSGDLHTPILLNRPDELGELAESLEATRQELHRSYETLQRRSEELLKKTEALEGSNAELERFAYAASHDLQEPVRTIISYMQMLERKCPDLLKGEAREYVQFVVQASKRLSSLIQDLLTYSRLGVQKPRLEPVDMNRIMSRVSASLKASIEESKAEIEVGSLPTVRADDTKMYQLMQNLVSNAIKYSPGHPKVKVSALNQPGEVWIQVDDNGEGIEEQYLNKIFELFQRLHSHSNIEGTGIGLALCKRIVEQHRGRIWATSTPHVGSRFIVALPNPQ